MIKEMEMISLDSTITERDKMSKITKLGSLAKEVLSDINEHKEYEK